MISLQGGIFQKYQILNFLIQSFPKFFCIILGNTHKYVNTPECSRLVFAVKTLAHADFSRLLWKGEIGCWKKYFTRFKLIFSHVPLQPACQNSNFLQEMQVHFCSVSTHKSGRNSQKKKKFQQKCRKIKHKILIFQFSYSDNLTYEDKCWQ